MNDTFFDRSKKRVIECIKKHLDLDVSDIPVMYVTNFEFYKCIKKNYKLRSESYEDIESVKERYRILCEIIPGMFKWKENKVYIKNEVESDFSLLLAELLHSKSITKGNASIRKWLSEGLVHYLEKILCKLCDIEYVESGHSDYFILREKVYDKYGLEVMKTIIFAEDIRITIRLLQHIFGYNDDDILELKFEEILKYL